MKKQFLIIVGIFLIILVNNIPPLHWLYENDCNFSNVDGSFTFAEMNFKERNFEKCQRKFLEFKKRQLGDTILYRLCPMNIFHFWDYGEYLFSQKYRVPYKPWREIDTKRGPITNKSGFQDF